MENLQLFAEDARPVDGIDTVWQSLEDWSAARAAHMDLQLLRFPRLNVLLTGTERVIQNVLDMMLPDIRMPLGQWRPGEHLTLPPVTQTGTLILRHVGGLTPDDQLRLVGWLELTAGRTQVISTTASPLMPRVQSGAFLDTLYYRLNTVCVDVNT